MEAGWLSSASNLGWETVPGRGSYAFAVRSLEQIVWFGPISNTEVSVGSSQLWYKSSSELFCITFHHKQCSGSGRLSSAQASGELCGELQEWPLRHPLGFLSGVSRWPTSLILQACLGGRNIGEPSKVLKLWGPDPPHHGASMGSGSQV